MIVVPFGLLLVLLGVLAVRRRTAGSVALAGVPVAWTPTVVVRAPRRWPVVRDLGRVEARKLVGHPMVVFGGLIALLSTGVGAFEPGPQAYFELTGSGGIGLYVPPLVFLATHLNVTRARRAGTGEVLASTATTPVDRTLAFCFAGVYVAAGVLAFVVVGTAFYAVVGTDMPRTPGPFELLLLPASVLGAVTLGTMVGRWLPWRGVGPAALVVLVAATLWITGSAVDQPLFVSFVDLVDWEATGHVDIAVHVPAAHALYLFGLDAMAVVGAVLHDTRTRVWWVLGFAAVVWTAAMGAWQVS